jgi:simple sugar transport system substrate-binding protein
MRFIYITPFVDEDFFIPVKKGMEDAAKLLGVESVFAGTPGSDIAELLALTENAINEKYDGIALSIAQPRTFSGVIQKSLNAGIPLLTFNMDDPHTARLAVVAQNFYKAGKGFADRALPYLKKGAKILFCMHDAGIEALEERLRGIRDGLQGMDLSTKIIISGNTSELAKKTILDNLDKDTEAILCTGQSDTHGAGLAASFLPVAERPYVAGFDVCNDITNFIMQGLIDFTVDQQPYIQGFYPLIMLYQYKKGKITPFNIDTGNVIVDKQNYGGFNA